MATEPLLAATRRSRGRAEAFARSLHSKLRSLSGSEAPETSDEADYDGDSGGGDNANANCHVRLCSSSSGDDIFFDMDLSPQSPEEEVSPSELHVLMVNSLNMATGIEEASEDTAEEAAEEEEEDSEVCPVSRSEEAEEAARSGTSPQSDCSSDYFDPESFEDARTDEVEEKPLLEGVVKVVTCNGFATDSANHLHSFAFTCAELLPTGTEAAASPPPQQNGEQPQHTERRHPWNRVNHRHKAGTPEALREIQNLPPEEDSDAEEKPVVSPSTRKAAVPLGKFVFEKSEEDKLQERAIEQIKQGKELPEEFKGGLCPGPLAEAAAAATVAEAEAETTAEVRVVEEETKAEEQGSEAGSEGTDSEGKTPRVRRCSSLKTGKTPPGTPGRKKIVRFADVLGLDLADVRTFLDEIPRVPSSAYSDLRGTEMAPVDAVPPIPQLALSFGAAPGRCLVAAFQQPGGQPDFLDRVRERQVCLENAIVRDPGLLSIAGTVRVRNLDFHKSVHVRYTTDGWRSFADLQASYVANSCDGFSDKFTFVLYAAHTMSVGQRLEFAVRFQCKGQQFWDANGGSNYAFECLPAASATGTCSMPMPIPSSPDDSSWRSFY